MRVILDGARSLVAEHTKERFSDHTTTISVFHCYGNRRFCGRLTGRVRWHDSACRCYESRGCLDAGSGSRDKTRRGFRGTCGPHNSRYVGRKCGIGGNSRASQQASGERRPRELYV